MGSRAYARIVDYAERAESGAGAGAASRGGSRAYDPADIGALSGVVPDALEFAFEALTPGTMAEGAQLAVERVPARFWCATCTREFQSDDLFAECPDCHSLSGELRAGREMELASLEID